MKHFDVLIVGAGVSGIGAACHLTRQCPGRSYTILEGRDAIGGTWDLFRYPGIRSDSDMHTFGYNFKPWLSNKTLADGPSIRAYVTEAAAEYDVSKHVRFGHLVRKAAWSSTDETWSVEVEREGGSETFTCQFLFMCGGYYSYEGGYKPDFPGEADFKGPLIHPQQWPDDLDYSGKKVAVIGSGATAVTLVPAMADTADHITMVQRSPTYVVSRPNGDSINARLRRWLPEKFAYAITRWKNISLQRLLFHRTRVAPEKVKRQLLKMVREQLGPDFDVDTHFTPSYNPWDQRLCLVPDADLFRSLKRGKASVVTGIIERITPRGIRMTSGEEVEADIIISATGLNLVVLSGVQFSLDGKPIDFADTWTYKGMMFSGVPNLVQTFGYVNASWTLRADLTAEYVCRLLNHMQERRVRQCLPLLREEDSDMPAKPWIDGFSPGYMARSMHLFPKQGDRDPWRNTQNYALDRKMVRRGPLEDGVLRFGAPTDTGVDAGGNEETRATPNAA